jgi:hypothetical protein
MSLMDSGMHPSRAVSRLSVASRFIVSCSWHVCSADRSVDTSELMMWTWTL